MLFNASALLVTRNGEPYREPKPGAPTEMRDLRHGDIAMLALDQALEGDDKAMKEDAAKWVKLVMRRETISAAIAEAMKDGDGWATLKDEHGELLIERLALLVPRAGVGMVGQVMAALDKAPEAKPTQPDKPKPNGQHATA
jgi:hypothetical protein